MAVPASSMAFTTIVTHWTTLIILGLGLAPAPVCLYLFTYILPLLIGGTLGLDKMLVSGQIENSLLKIKGYIMIAF